MIGTILIFVVLLFLSGFFSCAEIVMMSLPIRRVRQLNNQDIKNADRLEKLLEHPHTLLQTILIGNNLANISTASIATALAIEMFGNSGIGIATGITTFLVLMFGEIVPKSIGVNNKEAIALAITPIMLILTKVFKPIIIVINKLAKIFTRFFGKAETEQVTEEEINELIKEGEEVGSIKSREREIIENVFRFDDMTADEVMTPRLDVVCLDVNNQLIDVLDQIIEQGFSRFPVHDGNKDDIKGVLLLKDVLNSLGKKVNPKLSEIMVPAFFVPENRNLDSLLKEFQHKKNPFAIVIDEHGLFIGIVTIEDLLEELVGEIYDEDDAESHDIKKVSKGTFVVSGKALVEELNNEQGFSLPISEDYDTIAGLIMDKLGRVPIDGEEIEIEKTILVVNSMHRNRVNVVTIHRASQ